jgi:hypothetical protein
MATSARTKRSRRETKPVQSDPKTLEPAEKERLTAALETARENVKTTVKRLNESESVGIDLLSMRLESPTR